MGRREQRRLERRRGGGERREERAKDIAKERERARLRKEGEAVRKEGRRCIEA